MQSTRLNRARLALRRTTQSLWIFWESATASPTTAFRLRLRGADELRVNAGTTPDAVVSHEVLASETEMAISERRTFLALTSPRETQRLTTFLSTVQSRCSKNAAAQRCVDH